MRNRLVSLLLIIPAFAAGFLMNRNAEVKVFSPLPVAESVPLNPPPTPEPERKAPAPLPTSIQGGDMTFNLIRVHFEEKAGLDAKPAMERMEIVWEGAYASDEKAASTQIAIAAKIHFLAPFAILPTEADGSLEMVVRRADDSNAELITKTFSAETLKSSLKIVNSLKEYQLNVEWSLPEIFKGSPEMRVCVKFTPKQGGVLNSPIETVKLRSSPNLKP